MNSTLTSKEKSFLLNDAVYYEILFSCGVSAHDPTDYCSWEHLNFSRMGHARALLYFFECPSADKKWDDDVVSEDFGFPAAGIAIAKDERDRLNKDLFHLSSRRVRHTQSSKAWTNAVLNHIHERAVIFVDHLLTSVTAQEFEVARRPWEELARALKSGGEVKISRQFSSDGKDSGWMINIGHTLASGKSELTSIQAR